ncbi:MAG: hypothetical protein SFY32_10795 [Bacteroidota bacterium]|nr:hypothetical protein [Bacteroidota bacterium]
MKNLHKTAYLLLILVFINQKTFAIQGGTPGARFVGIGEASQAISDPWAIYYNPAGIASLEKTSVNAFYQNRYGFSGWNTTSFAYNQPLKILKDANVGVGAYRFGDELFSQTRASFAFAHKIRGVSLGIQAEYFQTMIQDIGTKSNVLINFGGQVQITKDLFFGASVYNINQARLTNYNDNNLDQRLPTIMRIGATYNPYKRLFLNAEAEKDVEKTPRYKIGVEYGIIDNLFLRTGFNVNPMVSTFGIGYKSFGFNLDYALQWHLQLGFIHSVGLGYTFGSFIRKPEPAVPKTE